MVFKTHAEKHDPGAETKRLLVDDHDVKTDRHQKKTVKRPFHGMQGQILPMSTAKGRGSPLS